MGKSKFPKRRVSGMPKDVAERSSLNMIAEVWDLVCDAPLTELGYFEKRLEDAEKQSRNGRVRTFAVEAGASAAGKDKGRSFRLLSKRRGSCPFSGKDAPKIDYNDVRLLQGFVSQRGKIVPSRVTVVSTNKQRLLTKAMKRVRGLGFWRGRPETFEV